MTSCIITKKAPEFKGQAVMPDGSFKELSLSQYQGSYVVLFFYPLDFTFVCPSEILAFNEAIEEFESRNVQVIGCSVDSHFTHAAWRDTPVRVGGIGHIKFPLLSDLSHDISKLYGCHIDSPAVALRALYLIDKAGILRHMVQNDLPLGRSITECIRMVDALQFTETHGEVCPANWRKGEKGMQATKEGVSQYLGSKIQ